MKRISALVLIFAVAFTIFLIGPPLLGFNFPLYPLMKTGDALDVLTPLVLLPLYWLTFTACCPGAAAKTRNILIFVVIAGLWAMGQGMHLSANSIGHLMKGLEGSDMFKLMYFYDEVFSHYLWHIGIYGMSAFLIFHEWKAGVSDKVDRWPVLLAGLIYGFSYFLIVIEAGTWPIGITFAIIMAIFGIVWGRKYITSQPLLNFFFTSHFFALGLFATWWVMWGGLPQFSQVGFL